MSRSGLTTWNLVVGSILGLICIGIGWVAYTRLPRWQFFLVVMVIMGLLSLGEVYMIQKGKNGIGKEGMIGRQGKVAKTCNPIGKVKICGELWTAESIDGSEIEEGQEVVVRDIEGLTLIVEAELASEVVQMDKDRV